MKTETINPDKFYTSEEVTDILRVSLRTTQRLLKGASLSSFKINGQYRIKGLDLLNFLNNVRLNDISGFQTEKEKPADLIPMLEVHPISVDLSLNLISLLDPPEESEVLKKLVELRKDIIKELGFIFPEIRFNDNTALKENSYQILINGNTVRKGTLFTDKIFIIPDGEHNKSGTEYTEPVSKVKGYWIEASEAENIHGRVFKPSDLLLDHIGFIAKIFAHEIISKEEVSMIIENLRKKYPVGVEEVIQDNPNETNKLSIGKLTKILRELLREQISIRNMRLILEGLGDFLENTTDPETLVEFTRQALSGQICSKLVAFDSKEPVIDVIALEPDFEKTLIEAVTTNSIGKKEFVVSPEITKMIMVKLKELKHLKVILCSPLLRKYLRVVLERNFPDVSVISYQEVGKDFKLNLVGTIG